MDISLRYSLDHMAVLFLILGGTSILFSIAALSFYLLTNNVQNVTISPRLTDLCYLFSFDLSHPNHDWKVISMNIRTVIALFAFVSTVLAQRKHSINTGWMNDWMNEWVKKSIIYRSIRLDFFLPKHNVSCEDLISTYITLHSFNHSSPKETEEFNL